MAEPSTVEIPNRPMKASEVCDLAKLQPYVLRSWEAEFRDLGVAREGSTARIYRREDVERVLRIKHLVLIEGLTLAGVRRRLEEEQEPPLELVAPPVARAAIGDAVRERVTRVKRELRSLLEMLSAPSPAVATASAAAMAAPAEFALAPPAEAESTPSTPGAAEGRVRAASPRRKRSA